MPLRQRRSQPTSGITVRAVVVGTVLTICHTIWILYQQEVIRHAGHVSILMPIPTVIGLMFAMLAVNSILKRISPSRMFSPVELMVVYCMSTVAAVIAGSALTGSLFGVILRPVNPLAAPLQQVGRFLGCVPDYLTPHDKGVVTRFFLGGHTFWYFFTSGDYKSWVVPLLFWGSVLFLLVWTTHCLASILRRQWVDRELLPFPLIQIPLAIVRERTVGGMFRDRTFLVGFGLAASMGLSSYLASVFPSFPSFTYLLVDVATLWFPNPPWSGMSPTWVQWYLGGMAVCYLIPLDVAFSSWFFYILLRLSMAFGTSLGWRDATAGLANDQFPYWSSIAEGAWLGMFISVMWQGKGHLAQVWRATRGTEQVPIDETEALPYRTAVLGAACGFVLLIGMMVVSGMQLHIAFLFFSIYFMAMVVMTRMYAQVALPHYSLYFFRATTFTTDLMGTAGLSAADATILTNFHWFDSTHIAQPMGHEMESIVFAERMEQSRRIMFHLVVVAMLIGVVVGLLTYLQIYYDKGAASLADSGIFLGGEEAWGRLTRWMSSPKPVQASTILQVSVSAAIVMLLAFLRSIWFWFPLHPIGYLFAASYAMEWIWFMVFTAWIIKAIVIRYGGLWLYRRSLPFFLGVIIGDAVAIFTITIFRDVVVRG